MVLKLDLFNANFKLLNGAGAARRRYARVRGALDKDGHEE